MSLELKKCPGCDEGFINEEIVRRLKNNMPEEKNLYDLAEFLKIFGDLTRIKIIWALGEGEMCVCDIAYLLNMSQSAISHQLRVLKHSKMVKSRKEGRNVYYSLDDEHIKQIFDLGLVHIME